MNDNDAPLPEYLTSGALNKGKLAGANPPEAEPWVINQGRRGSR
jgi:hypothetical protein